MRNSANILNGLDTAALCKILHLNHPEKLNEAGHSALGEIKSDYNLDCLPPLNSKIIAGAEAFEVALFPIEVEWIFISFVTISHLFAAITLGLSLLFALMLFCIIYHIQNKRNIQEAEYYNTLLSFNLLQRESATLLIRKEFNRSDEDEVSIPDLLNSPMTGQTNILQKSEWTGKSLAMATLLTSGLILTCWWALPDVLNALGATTAIASAVSPVGFAIFGVLTACSLAYLSYKMYRLYQNNKQCNRLLAGVNRRKISYSEFYLISNDKRDRGEEVPQKAAKLLGFKHCER